MSGPPGWHVQQIHEANARKVYRCPGCERDINVGVPHVVAWQDGYDRERRHWHRACWTSEVSRLRGGGASRRY